MGRPGRQSGKSRNNNIINSITTTIFATSTNNNLSQRGTFNVTCLFDMCVQQSNFIIDGIRNNENFENLILGPHSSRREKNEFDHSTVLSSPKKALHVGRWWWQHSNYPLHMYSIRAFGRYVLVSHQPRRTARLIYGIMFQMSSKKVNARDHKC